MQTETWHDMKPTHRKLSAAVIAAQQAFDAASFAFGSAMEDYYAEKCDILAVAPYEQALTAAEAALVAARAIEHQPQPADECNCFLPEHTCQVCAEYHKSQEIPY